MFETCFNSQDMTESIEGQELSQSRSVESLPTPSQQTSPKLIPNKPYLVEILPKPSEGFRLSDGRKFKKNEFDLAFEESLKLENDHSFEFFQKLSKTLDYLRINLQKSDRVLLGTFLADYKKCRSENTYKLNDNNGLPVWTPPKLCTHFDGETHQTRGLDILLKNRLEELGAFAHIKTISGCSTGAIWLYEPEKSLTAAYNLPCRKPSCQYCSFILKEKGNKFERSQAISERGKHHLRYVTVDGEVKFYGRMIFTFPKEIQEYIDRRDLKNWEEYGHVQVYGSKVDRDIYELREESKRVRESLEYSEEDKLVILEGLRSRRKSKKRQLREFEELEKELENLKEKRKKIYKLKSKGYSKKLLEVRKEIRKLKEEIERKKELLEGGRIVLEEIQKECYEFLKENLGIEGALLTPHLTGDESALMGELHPHFHGLFPIFGKEEIFDWSKGQPFLEKEVLGELNRKWKKFLEERFEIKIEGDVANPEYGYVEASSGKVENLQKLAFWVRYDHRIEAGGPWFPLFGEDKEVCKVLRMTVRQRYTRGYGCLSDSNLKEFEENVGGKLLREVLVENGEEKEFEGIWEVLTEEKLRSEVSFISEVSERREEEGKKEEEKLLKDGVKNLPVKVEEGKENLVFVRFTEEEPKSFGSGRIFYFHREMSVWSSWRCEYVSGGKRVFYFRGALGRLPEGVHERGNGFFVWGEDDGNDTS